jgi:hypothetical protein
VREGVKVVLGVLALIIGASAPTLILESVFFRSIYQAEHPRDRNIKGSGQEPNRPYSQNQASAPSPPGADATSAQITEGHAATGTSQSEQNNSNSEPSWVAIAQGLSAIAGLIVAAVIAVINFGQWSVYRRQARIMMRQLAIARTSANAAKRSADAAKESADFTQKLIVASQRAWLTVEASLVKGQEQIVFSRDGAVLPIRIDTKNIGNSPAIKVSWHAWLIFAGSGSNALQEQSLRCNRILQQPFGIGPTIFPQDRYPDPAIHWSFGAGANWEEIDKTIPHIIVSLVGCIDYTFPTDPDFHHQTGFVYYMRMTDSQIPEITEQSGNIPIAVQRLVKADITLDPGAF